VSGGSTSAGAPIIQWWADSGAEQEWLLPRKYRNGEIYNQNSGMCITTDGVAGDQLYQDYCSNSENQRWYAEYQLDGPTVYVNQT
jgi:hypothetical protein